MTEQKPLSYATVAAAKSDKIMPSTGKITTIESGKKATLQTSGRNASSSTQKTKEKKRRGRTNPQASLKPSNAEKRRPGKKSLEKTQENVDMIQENVDSVLDFIQDVNKNMDMVQTEIMMEQKPLTYAKVAAAKSEFVMPSTEKEGTIANKEVPALQTSHSAPPSAQKMEEKKKRSNSNRANQHVSPKLTNAEKRRKKSLEKTADQNADVIQTENMSEQKTLTYAKVAAVKSDKGLPSAGKITTIELPEKKEVSVFHNSHSAPPSTQKAREKKKRSNSARANPHAPPKLSHAERTSRGPLPEWDEIQNCANSFDYMGIRDKLYAQYFVQVMPQPVDGNNNCDQARLTMIQDAQNNMSTYGYRPVVSVPYGYEAQPMDQSYTAEVINPMAYYPEFVATRLSYVPMYAIPGQQIPKVAISDEDLQSQIRTQIEYYLSAENLEKDFYLRDKMDKEGYLPLSLVLTFPRIRKLTIDPQYICNALRLSDKVELTDDNKRIRARNDPEQKTISPTTTTDDDKCYNTHVNLSNPATATASCQ